MAVAPGGGVVTLGHRSDGAMVSRWTPTGAPDTTLPAGGLGSDAGPIAGTYIDGRSNLTGGLAVAGDGAIVFSETVIADGTAHVCRLLSSGLDPTFAGGTCPTMGSPNIYLSSVVPTPTGDIYAGGFTELLEGGSNVAFGHLSADGTSVGLVAPHNPSASCNSFAGVIDGPEFVLAGICGNAAALARGDYVAGVDSSFAGGYVIDDPGARHDSGFYGVALDGHSRIVAVGAAASSQGVNLGFVTRFNSLGGPDTGFGDGGQVTPILGQANSLQGVAIDSDGRIVVVGYIGGVQALVMRFWP
jgi:hypothetical protein